LGYTNCGNLDGHGTLSDNSSETGLFGNDPAHSILHTDEQERRFSIGRTMLWDPTTEGAGQGSYSAPRGSIFSVAYHLSAFLLSSGAIPAS
jgi:hypothetical protein